MKLLLTMRAAALLLGLLGAAPQVRAQMSPDLIMETYNSNISVITNGVINKAMLDGAIARNNRGSSAGRGAAPTRPAASTSLASTTYTPTPALRRQTVQSYVDRLQSSNPAAAQVVTTAFGPGKYDYGQVYHGIMKESGLRENDATDVLAGYLIMGWIIMHNVQNGNAITVTMARGVRAQVAPLLATNAQARSRAAQVGEELKLQTVIVQGGWQAAIKEGKLAAYQQGISQLFKTQYSLNLSQLKLTSQGFAQR